MNIKRQFIKGLALLACTAAFSSASLAQVEQVYTVTVTNLTKGISFTPLLTATHTSDIKLFEVGQASSDALSRIAEGGDVSVLKDSLDLSDKVASTHATAGLLLPGKSVSYNITSRAFVSFVSITSMALPTNDTLVALNHAVLPGYRTGIDTYYMTAYDAGTETNDELCANIPGPRCGGTPFSPEDEGEGYIFPAQGIHGEADLKRSTYDWRGKVAKVVIKRIR